MTKKIQLALTAALALSATSLLATNGSNLIATGSAARAMGGTGIGISHGAESGLANVALITSVEATQVSFGGMFFMPKVSNSNALVMPTYSTYGQAPDGQYDQTGSADSAADLNVIPEVSIATKINNNLYLGMGIWGTAGMGVDYRDTTGSGQMNMVTNLQLMQFAFPLAYKSNGMSIGFTPILQYGALDINYNLSPNLQHAMTGGQYPVAQLQNRNVGAGMAQDLQFGYNLGVAYETNGITVGAMYKSQIDMTYKGVLSSTVGAMGAAYTNDKLSTPSEMGLGASYKYKNHRIALDYKVIQWSLAKGYQDFDWDDQKVAAIGYEYATQGWSLRAGYNYASSQITQQKPVFNAQGADTNTNSAGLSASLVNTFNTLGFPGIIKTHYTFGGSFDLNKQTAIALAYMYAPQEKVSLTNFLNQASTTTHSQSSLSFDLIYNF